MTALVYLFELFVGLLAVLAISATVYFAGAFIILGLIGAAVLFVIWSFGQYIVKTFKGTK